MLIFVFDPLAVLLLVSSLAMMTKQKEIIEEKKPPVIEQRYVLQVPKKRVQTIKTDK
jgi:hypothetical protein